MLVVSSILPSATASFVREFPLRLRRCVPAIHQQSSHYYMKTKKFTFTLSVSAFVLSLFAAPLYAAQLTDQNKQFLAAYEKVHHALVADDLAGAKSAASDLGIDGAELSKSVSLKDARAVFEKLSAKAKELAAGQPGYYVYHCPMLKKDWVQTSTTTANPYAGKDMVGCGEIQK
jgi:hypothetical protein